MPDQHPTHEKSCSCQTVNQIQPASDSEFSDRLLERKMATVLHRMRADGTEFAWGKDTAAAAG